MAQTFSDFEILLINDGSTDKSGVICDEYAEKDFRVRVYHKVNGGVTSARRLGVEKSLGEWISFVDSDDIVKSDYCDVLIREIENDVDIIATRISNEKIKEGIYSNYEFIKNILLASIARGVPAKLYRRSLFTNEIFCLSPEFRQGEDEIMNLRVGLYAKNIKVKAKNVYTYRHNLESVTNTTKFSLQYEEMLMGELKNSLGNLWQRFDDTLKARNLLTLENLIVCRVSVPYNRLRRVDCYPHLYADSGRGGWQSRQRAVVCAAPPRCRTPQIAPRIHPCQRCDAALEGSSRIVSYRVLSYFSFMSVIGFIAASPPRLCHAAHPS